MSIRIRFHLDESVTRRVADGLRRRNCDCTSSPEECLLGRSDAEQLAFAKAQGRVLITSDTDFLRLVATTSDHAGVIFWLRDRHFGQLVRDLHALTFERTAEEMRGQVAYLP